MKRLTEKRCGKNVIPLRQNGKIKWSICSAGMGDAPTEYLYGDHADRLAAIEDILGDEYDLDELREMVQAKREGRCVVLPCKIGDTIYQVDYMTHGEALRAGVPEKNDPQSKRKFGRRKAKCLPLMVREKKMVKSLYSEFGKSVFLTRAEAEAALRREQDGE